MRFNLLSKDGSAIPSQGTGPDGRACCDGRQQLSLHRVDTDSSSLGVVVVDKRFWCPGTEFGHQEQSQCCPAKLVAEVSTFLPHLGERGKSWGMAQAKPGLWILVQTGRQDLDQ